MQRICDDAVVPVSRADRRRERQPRVETVFAAPDVDAALDLLELLELAWHDCYGDVSPPDEVVEDVLLLGEGSMEKLVRAARLAVSDWRDLKVAATAKRESRA
jgi:hypothetical protein